MEKNYVNQINVACVNNKQTFIVFKVQWFGMKNNNNIEILK
jgi:hypothetical protein